MTEKIQYQIKDSQLFLNGNLVPFDYDVYVGDRTIVQVKDRLLVVLNPTRKDNGHRIPPEERNPIDSSRNAYAVDSNGNIIWRAEALTANHSYLGFNVKSDTEVIAVFDWEIAKPIDVETGKLISARTGKFLR